MRYVQVVATAEGAYFLDPEPYLRELPDFQNRLPEGARAFALDPDHYDFNSPRCVKDLRVGQVTLRETGHATLGVELSLTPNRFKHSSGLLLRYDGVTSIDIDVNESNPSKRVWPESPRLGDLQLDEILPIARGCSHEIKFTGGKVAITCEDLRAEWMP